MTPLEVTLILLGVTELAHRLDQLIEYLDGGQRHGGRQRARGSAAR